MRKFKIVIVSLSIPIICLLLIIVVLQSNDNQKIDKYIDVDSNYEKNTYIEEKDFFDINVTLITKGINISYSKDDTCTIKYYSSQNIILNIAINEGVLEIIENDLIKQGLIVIDSTSNKIKMIELSLPNNYHGNIKISADSEMIKFNELILNDVIIESKLSKVILRDIHTNNINITTTLGNVTLTGVVSNDVIVESKTGEILLDDNKLNKFDLVNNSGSLNIFDSTIVDFVVNNNSGSIITDKSFIDNININTKSGDIDMHLYKDVIDYKVCLISEHGDVYYQDEKQEDEFEEDEKNYNFIVRTIIGDVNIIVDIPVVEEVENV